VTDRQLSAFVVVALLTIMAASVCLGIVIGRHYPNFLQ
jgi:hypothetical protein